MRFYGVSLDGAGSAYSWRDCAAMVAHLPSESALRRAEGDGWSEAERLLALIADNTSVIRWQPTDHNLPGNAEPARCRSPRERELAAERAAEDTYTEKDMDDIAEMLGIPEGRR
ncbi:MAG: hypothetical protein Q4B91_03535 [Atopobiaceae bacterium]|nr:hypothetical protein [Atopobiaceae bacterium]